MLGKEGEDEKCKTAVFAMAKKNMNGCIPVIFQSYRVDADSSPYCTIREALHATMAHPDLFKSIDIGSSHLKQSFVGGEIGCSNPTIQVLAEVKKLYPNRHVACIISIGAGHACTIQVPDPCLAQKLFCTQDVVAMKQMATDSERVAEELAARFKATGVYFRLNVDRGMQDMLPGSWERLSEVLAHVKSYLHKPEVEETMERAIRSISERRATISTHLIDGQIPGEVTKRSIRLKRCPAPTPVYTGRDTESERLINCLTRNNEERCICVVHGLGGVGKTQLILNVIERTCDEWDCVIYVDANSKAVIKNALQDLAVAKGVGETHEDAVDWLESCHERWLLVLDNADDQALVTQIKQYIPGGRQGKIVITTRLVDLVVLAKGAGSMCHISSMSQEDGLALLIKTARMEDQTLSVLEMEAAIALLQDFGCLALAIVHAGAYMRKCDIGIAKYCQDYLSRQRDILKRSGKLHGIIDGYGKSVYTTWDLNYNLLQNASKHMLGLMAFLHYDHIHEELFKRATRNILFYEVSVPLNEVEKVACRRLKDSLSIFIDSEGHWDTMKFRDIMADLRLCSLVHFDRMNLTYSIHILVQDWVRAEISQPPEIASECVAMLLSTSMIGLWDNTGSFVFEWQLWPHVNHFVELKHKAGPGHESQFSFLCLQMGKWDMAEQLAKGCTDGCEVLLGKDDPSRCMSLVFLSVTYLATGQWTKAEEKGVQALNKCRRILGEDDVSMWRAKECLAEVYSQLGHLDEAKHLQIEVLQARRQAFPEVHPDTLHSMGQLARIYSSLGQWDEAEELWMGILKIQQRWLSEGHKTLGTMSHLVTAYWFLGRHKEAEQLQAQILNSSKQSLQGSHLGNLGTMDLIAFNHTLLGWWDKAAKLHTQIIDTRKQLLDEKHPHTLKSIQSAAITYAHLLPGSEAELLLATAMGISKGKLGNGYSNIRWQFYHLSHLLWVESERSKYSPAYKGIFVAVVILHPLLIVAHHFFYGSKLSLYLLPFSTLVSVLCNFYFVPFLYTPTWAADL